MKTTNYNEIKMKTEEMLSKKEFDDLVVKTETALPTEVLNDAQQSIQDILTNDGLSETKRREKLASLFAKQNKELEKAAKEQDRNFKVTTCVVETNNALKLYKQSHIKLFDTVRTAYFDLKDDTKALSQYKILVDIDRSSINKIIAIVKCDYVQKNLSVLPVAWSVLYALTKMTENQLMTSIKNNKINYKSSLSEVNKVRAGFDNNKKENKKKNSSEIQPNTVWIKLDELKINKRDQHQLRKMLVQLDTKFGIKTTGMNLYVEQVRKVA